MQTSNKTFTGTGFGRLTYYLLTLMQINQASKPILQRVKSPAQLQSALDYETFLNVKYVAESIYIMRKHHSNWL